MTQHMASPAALPTPTHSKNKYVAVPAAVQSKTGTKPKPQKGSRFGCSIMTGLYHA